MAESYAALVLAGRRGAHDPLASARSASHRALLPVAGTPMLLRVVRALEASSRVDGIQVSIDDAGALDAEPELAERRASGRLEVHTSLDSPSRSVDDALAHASGLPVLVTTADHALLTSALVDSFLERATDSEADLAVGLVERRVVEAGHPGASRTYFKLRGGAWTGANLFAFRSNRARRAAEFWTRAEALRKQPWRVLGAIGPSLLVGAATRTLDLDGALRRLSNRIGATVRPIALDDPEAAIDVDKPSDLELAEAILAQRET